MKKLFLILMILLTLISNSFAAGSSGGEVEKSEIKK